MLAYSVEDNLQKSLDAAGLAAGRTALPENVEADARSYFNTNFGSAPGLAEFDAEDLDIEVSEVGDELVLSATAVMPTRFMRLFGHDTVTVAATTRINREVRQMELALVLDNTGSMWGTPFTTMQAAAKDLVDIVYGDDGHQPEPVCGRRALRRYRQHGQLADRLAGRRRSSPRARQPLRPIDLERLRHGPDRRVRSDRRSAGDRPVQKLSLSRCIRQ